VIVAVLAVTTATSLIASRKAARTEENDRAAAAREDRIDV
jgi:type II secretory pathway pseudopilin PulG